MLALCVNLLVRAMLSIMGVSLPGVIPAFDLASCPQDEERTFGYDTVEQLVERRCGQ